MSASVTAWPPEKIGIAVSLSVVPFLIGMVLSFFFRPNKWYKELRNPCWCPPPWVYFIVWAIMYALLGVSATMATYGRDPVYWTLPILNIAVGLLFVPVLFGMQSLFGGVIITFICFALGIGVLWQFAVLGEYVPAGLMVPYVAWMLFALYLAWGYYVLNPDCGASIKDRRKTSSRRYSGPCLA